MDTRAVADQLGTDPKTLRRFIRSNACPFDAVGAGGRYDFTPADVTAMADPFRAWSAGTDAPKPKAAPKAPRTRRAKTQAEIDAAVWAEEGPVVLPDIRDPHVLAEVRRLGAERAARLDERLLAAGLHISQHRVSA